MSIECLLNLAAPCEMFTPPKGLAATLSENVLDHRHTASFDCPWASPNPEIESLGSNRSSRRGFLTAAAAALFAFGVHDKAMAADNLDTGAELWSESPNFIKVAGKGAGKLGDIPKDFWERPRSLRLQRSGNGKVLELVYWKDGKLIPSAYWQICALMRDVRANVMTTIDPGLLDILRGVAGYYEAWGWPHHTIVTSGFRTVATNRALSREGSAKNSYHVQGKAVDMYIPGVPPRDVALLGMHLKQGGVGFYPSKGFTHLDTGSLRTWRG